MSPVSREDDSWCGTVPDTESVLQYAIAIGNTLCGGGGWRREWSLGTPVDFSKIGVWELLVTMNVGGVSFSKIHIFSLKNFKMNPIPSEGESQSS